MSNLQHCGFISLLYSIGDKPLSLWSKYISPDGKVRRVTDGILNGEKVIEITGPHDVSVCTNIACPSNSMEVLNIKLPILVLIIKNLELKLKLEFQILDKKKYRRKFTFTTYETTPTVNVTTAQLPLKLEQAWNNLEINFQTLCLELFGTEYEVLQRIIIYPNCCLRRVYLQDRHYEHDETPIELCQAFFDMYMLKWGIHLVERSSQTEESYTGPLQPCDLELHVGSKPPEKLECASKKRKAAIPIIQKPSIALYNVSKQTGNKFISCTHIIEKDEIVVKPNSKSVNELKANGKTKKQKNENDLEKESRNDKPENKFELETKPTASPSIYLNETNVPAPKALLNFSHPEKSQYLQTLENPFSNKFEKEGQIFSKWPYKFEKLKEGMKLKSTSHNQNPKMDNNNLTLPTKLSLLKEKNAVILDQNVRNIKNIMNEIQRVKEQLTNKNYNLEVEFQTSSDTVIPYFVELEAKPSENRSRSKLLTSDKLVSEFLKSRFMANRKMYERLKEKGMTMTDVELSIYNSKNRRNCYGQGKIIESCKGSTNKATGLGVIKSPEIKASPKGEKINDDENGSKSKKELDVLLFPLQDSNKNTSSTQLLNINKSADTKPKIKIRKKSSNVRSKSVNFLWEKAKRRKNNADKLLEESQNQGSSPIKIPAKKIKNPIT